MKPQCAEHKVACYQEWICPECIEAVEENVMFDRGPLLGWSSVYMPKWWTYHRMANCGRIQIGKLIMIVPLRWHPNVRDLPGYGRKWPLDEYGAKLLRTEESEAHDPDA